jgi:hypothetical protein
VTVLSLVCSQAEARAQETARLSAEGRARALEAELDQMRSEWQAEGEAGAAALMAREVAHAEELVRATERATKAGAEGHRRAVEAEAGAEGHRRAVEAEAGEARRREEARAAAEGAEAAARVARLEMQLKTVQGECGRERQAHSLVCARESMQVRPPQLASGRRIGKFVRGGRCRCGPRSSRAGGA